MRKSHNSTPMFLAFKRFLRTNPYLGPPSRRAYEFWLRQSEQASWKCLRALTPATKSEPEVFVFSRYGNDTLGDCFTLLGLLNALHTTVPQRRVIVVSVNPESTSCRLREMRTLLLRYSRSELLEHYINEQVSVVGEAGIAGLGPADLLMLGGGPIVDHPSLVKWVSWFHLARRIGAHTMIAGCGVSHFQRKPNIFLAESLFSLTDIALLRNTPPDGFRRALKGRWRLTLDPAFLSRSLLVRLSREKKPMLAVNVRTWCNHREIEQDYEISRIVENAVSYLEPLAQNSKLQGIIPFSTCEEGHIPDSFLSCRTATAMGETFGIPIHQVVPSTMSGVVESLAQAEYLVSVRLHGFILGLILGCRAAHLDYIQGGGKGSQFYQEWLGLHAAPSLFRPGRLLPDDCVPLSALPSLQASVDALCDVYASAIREVCQISVPRSEIVTGFRE